MTSCTRSLELLDTELDEAQRAHVAACPDCRLLLGDGPVFGRPDPTNDLPLPPPPMQALEALRAQPRAVSWTRPLWILIAVELLVVVVAGALFALRATQPVNGASPAILISLGLGILGLIAFTGWVAFRPRWRVGMGWVLSGLGAVLAAAILWGGTGTVFRPTWEGILHCATVMAALSVLPLLGALWGLRELARHPGRSLAAGLSAAGVGLLLLHVVCPDGTGLHLLLGHLAPWGALAAAVLWLRGRVPTRSHAP